jgi:phosphate transport system substrate-binding protein
MMEASRFDDLTRRDALKAFGGAGAVAVAGCTETENGDSAGLSGDINIAGSSTVFPLMSAIAEEFSSEHPDVKIDISSTGSGGGFSNHFCPGNTDFNNASREIQPEEEELCAENGVDYIELVAATDALTVVVNNEADFVDCLTIEELASIWESDAVETWDEVRDEFPNEEIHRYGAADTSGTYDYFIENVQGSDAGHTDDYQATERDDTIAQGVAGNEYAIGYFGFSYYYNNPDDVKALGIDNGDGCVKPSLDTAASGEYQPLSRELYTYPAMSSLAKDHVAEFARFFVEQTTNEDLVAGDVGYVPLSEEKQEEQMEKLEAAIEEAQG